MPREESLSEAQIQDLKQALLDLQVELVEYLSSAKESSAPVDLDSPIGRLSRMDAIQQQQMAKANIEAAKLRVKAVDSALKRIENDSYGECIKCGEFIAFGRLKAKPESTLCVECHGERWG